MSKMPKNDEHINLSAFNVLKHEIWIPNRNFGCLDFGFAGCNLHLQNVEFRRATTETHPKGPSGHKQGHSIPPRLKLYQKSTKKNIRLHHFCARHFVGIIHYQGIKQFQIAIAELQCKKVLLHHLWCLGLLLAPDSDKKRTTSGCPLSAAMERGVLPFSVVPRPFVGTRLRQKTDNFRVLILSSNVKRR